MQAPETEHRELQTGGAAGHLAEGRRELTHVKVHICEMSEPYRQKKSPETPEEKTKAKFHIKTRD